MGGWQSPSALFGEPPNNQDDWYVIRGYGRLANVPDDMYDPSKGLPFPFQRPPNVHYKSRGPGMEAGAAVAIAMVILLTGTRLCLRIFRKDLKFGLDHFDDSDVAIIPAALATIAWLSTVVAQAAAGGVGKHVYDQTYQEIYWDLRLGYCGTLVFFIAVSLIKIAIVLFNRRLTGLTSRAWMIAHYSFLAVVIAFLITAIFSWLFRCTGSVEWTTSILALGKAPPSAADRHCLDINKLGYGLAIVHSALDFALLTVPLIVLYQMRMTTAKKLRLGFLFAIGAVSCIGSVMRQIIQEQTIDSPDQNWVYPHIASWAIVDIFFGIVAANLPVLNALLPKRWRSGASSANMPQLSSWKSDRDRRGPIQLRNTTPPTGPDGTLLQNVGDVSKDTFHEKTEKRWEEAFTRKQRKSEADVDLEENEIESSNTSL
ncbi:hypothetical protein ACLMJK_001153 [Lecanora helva]